MSIISEVLPTAISVAAVFAGFVTTALSILSSMTGSRIVKNLKEKSPDKWHLLICYHEYAIWGLVIFVVFALATMVWKSSTSPTSAPNLLLAAMTGVAAYSFTAFVRVTWLISSILKGEAATRTR